ncbi:MAG TPA: hypothetical protein PKZ84_19135 [Anaerolineae bacterium]|nr:hypothetical protein [Anaerolineae bacterium]HQI87020.1 hypothetical protein [Anaerolineae bacterium]
MTDIMDFLLPMLGFLIVGIVGVTFWVAWIIFRMRHKQQLAAPETISAALPSDEASRAVSLLALDRAADGAWVITVQGERYPVLEAVPDDTVRQEVVAGLKELVAFARSYVQREQAAKKSPQPAPSPAPQPLPQPEPPREPAPPATPKVAPAPAPTPAAASPVQDKLRVFLKGEPTLKRSDTAPTIMPMLDLAREIGEIVSEMQMKIPSLARRSIRLQNAPSGGVHFAIDGIVYPDVNDIPDADIQALIRAATKEWERR